jgi:phosphoribosylformylglycinamidine (FGAM) synthase-like amidotransferase family enzyme
VKSGRTKELRDFIETQVVQGVRFLEICNGIAAMTFKEYYKRMECYAIFQNYRQFERQFENIYIRLTDDQQGRQRLRK